MIEVQNDQHDLLDLFNRIREAEPVEGRALFTRVGRLIEESNYSDFKELAEDLLVFGLTIDIENWTRTAMKAVFLVCSERDIHIEFKNGKRLLSFVSFPKEGLLLESILDAIIKGEW